MFWNIVYLIDVWFSGEQSHLMTFYAETKMENYEAAIGLVKEALFNVEFSSDRAKTIISKYMNRYTRLSADLRPLTS